MESADVVVIGAGIFGASIAFQLARRGAGRVVLIDERGPAGGMSGRTFNQVRRHYSNELTIRLANRGFEVLDHWADEVGVGDPGYVRFGYLLLVPEEAVEACKGNIALGTRCGVDTRFLEPGEIPDVEPLVNLDGVAGAAFEPDGGVIDVHKMILSWVVAGIGHGLVTRFGAAVAAVEAEGDGVTGVRLRGGDVVRTPVVVNAAGLWGRDLVAPLGVALPIAFFRLHMAYLRQRVGQLQLRVAVTDTAGGLVMRPDQGPLALAVAYEKDQAPRDRPSDDAGVAPGYERFLRETLRRRVPAYADATWERAVSGLYDVTPDWHPILGWAPGVEGLYLALGWSGHGLKLAPAVGEVVAQEVLNETPSIDISPLRLQRFQEGRLMHLAYGPGARA